VSKDGSKLAVTNVRVLRSRGLKLADGIIDAPAEVRTPEKFTARKMRFGKVRVESIRRACRLFGFREPYGGVSRINK
jgi:hypothetical protein